MFMIPTSFINDEMMLTHRTAKLRDNLHTIRTNLDHDLYHDLYHDEHLRKFARKNQIIRRVKQKLHSSNYLKYFKSSFRNFPSQYAIGFAGRIN